MVDSSNLCGVKVAVQTGTTQEEEVNKANEQCKARAGGRLLDAAHRHAQVLAFGHHNHTTCARILDQRVGDLLEIGRASCRERV